MEIGTYSRVAELGWGEDGRLSQVQVAWLTTGCPPWGCRTRGTSSGSWLSCRI